MPGPSASPSSGALVTLGWDDRVAALYASSTSTSTPTSASTSTPAARPGAEPGRVVRVDYDRCLVATPSGVVAAASRPLPVTGDWVCLHEATVVDVLPRWSELARAGQVLAANVDLVIVVAALDRPLNINRIERELVMAWDSGARPLVVLAKADCVPEPHEAAAAVESRAVGTDVVVTSARSGSGVEEVAARLRPHRSAVLLGPSGAGKSTLANRLLGRDALDTAQVRAGDHKGRHTTTARHLVVVPGGGVLIDTPGLRSLSLAGAEEGVAAAFSDIEALARDCRFRDCRHDGEPGCAVAAAVEEGELDQARVGNYRKIERDLERQARTAWERTEAERKWKVISKSLRDNPKR